MKRLMALLGALALLTTIPALQGCRSNQRGDTSATPPTTANAESTPTAGGELPVIGHGSEVNLQEHLVAGKTTVFDFFSENCPACRMLAPELKKLAARRPDLAIVEIDVNRPDVTNTIDWDSPVVRQYGISSLPHLVIFDAQGNQIASGDDARERVARWIEG